MTRNQKILLGLAGAGVLAYFLWKNRKPAVAPETPNSAKVKCEQNFLEANHPDVARTPEEQAAYKKAWIDECMTMV